MVVYILFILLVSFVLLWTEMFGLCLLYLSIKKDMWHVCFTKHILQPHHQLVSWRVGSFQSKKPHLCCPPACWRINVCDSSCFSGYLNWLKKLKQWEHRIVSLNNLNNFENTALIFYSIKIKQFSCWWSHACTREHVSKTAIRVLNKFVYYELYECMILWANTDMP